MFKKNLEELKKSNKVLARKLSKMTLEKASEHIEVYQAESNDLLITYDGLALDDIYDPVRVAKTNWNTNAPKKLAKYDIIFIFGLGLGYLFKRAYVNSNCRIILYEPKLEILRYVLEYVDFSQEIADNRVYITSEKTCALNFITEKYLSDDNLIFLYPQAYAQLLTQEMIQLTDDIVQVCNLKKMDVNTITKLAKNWAKHSMQNITNMSEARPFSWLKNKYTDKTALIVGAGPSLKDNIEKIKENRDKFIIFCVNKAARFLFENDITPDFVLFADTLNISPTINDIEDKLRDTNIIADFRTYNLIFEKFNNILTYFSKNDLVAQNINNITNNVFDLSETAGTAVAQAYYCAKIMGIKNMIFAGLDLAFKGDTIYADGNKLVRGSDNSLELQTKCQKSIVTVKDLNGNEVETRDDYALFIRQFADIFEADTISNLYNVSDFGAYIKGMEYCKLEDIIADLKNTDINISDDIKKFFNSTKEDWDKVYSEISDYLASEKKSLSALKLETKALLDKEIDILNQINDTEFDADMQNKISELSKEFSDFLPKVLGDAFLSQYFQSEFVSFVNLNNQSINQGTEAFVKLKNFEIQLLNGIIEISDEWIKFLEVKYK